MSMTADNTLPTATPVQSGETGFDALLESLAQADGAAAQTLPADADAVSAMPVNVQVGTDAQVEAQAGEVAPQAIENANVQAAEAQGDSQKAATPPAATFELLQNMAMDLATAKPATDAADEQTVKTVAKKPQHDETTDTDAKQTDVVLQNNLTGVAVQQAVEAVSVLPVTLPVEAIAANATASQQTSAAPILPAQSDVNATEQTQATQSADTAAIVQNAAVTVPATQDAPLVNAAQPVQTTVQKIDVKSAVEAVPSTREAAANQPAPLSQNSASVADVKAAQKTSAATNATAATQTGDAQTQNAVQQGTNDAQPAQSKTPDAKHAAQAQPLTAMLAQLGATDVKTAVNTPAATSDAASQTANQQPSQSAVDVSAQVVADQTAVQHNVVAKVQNTTHDTSVQPVKADATGTNSVTASQASTNGDTNDAHSDSSNSGNANSTAHSAQADAVQTGTTALRTDFAGVAQTTAVPVHAELQTAITAHTTSTTFDGSTHSAAMADDGTAAHLTGAAAANMPGISTARLVQTLSDSEMRVGMHSSEFGSISIRTTVSQQQMQTQIAVDHSELGTALSAHIPSMQAKLGSDFGLQATIEVNQSGAGFTGNGQQSQQQQSQPSAPAYTMSAAPAMAVAEIAAPQMAMAMSSNDRLDVQA
ncbi:MAG TPA: hypothetical protein VF392_13640 [Terracidiphilus sp.]